MRIEEIALRQEIRQMLCEAGVNKNTLHDIAKEVMHEEVAKQVKNVIDQSNINSIIQRKVSSYELNCMLRAAIREEISDAVDIKIDVKATVPQRKAIEGGKKWMKIITRICRKTSEQR